MKISDIDPARLQKPAVDSQIIFEGSLASQGFVVRRIELRRYSETNHTAGSSDLDRSKEQSLLIALVEMDKGSVEMKYLEAPGGREVLESTAEFLLKYAGISSLVNRAILEYLAHDSDDAPVSSQQF